MLFGPGVLLDQVNGCGGLDWMGSLFGFGFGFLDKNGVRLDNFSHRDHFCNFAKPKD